MCTHPLGMKGRDVGDSERALISVHVRGQLLLLYILRKWKHCLTPFVRNRGAAAERSRDGQSDTLFEIRATVPKFLITRAMSGRKVGDWRPISPSPSINPPEGLAECRRPRTKRMVVMGIASRGL